MRKIEQRHEIAARQDAQARHAVACRSALERVLANWVEEPQTRTLGERIAPFTIPGGVANN